MAVTTGFQGRTFDVPRTGVACIDPPRRAPCAAADAVFADAKAFLSSSEARQMSASELERELHRRGQELVRKLLQGHRDQRSPKEAAGPAEDTSGVECSEPREHESHAETASGTMQVVGLSRRGHDGLHGSALNLLPERYWVEMRRRVTIATASPAPPRTPWKPPWYSTSSTWQRRRGVRCPSPAHRRACRHLVRDPMGADRRTVTLGSRCDGPQPPRVASSLDAYEEPGQRGAGARPGQPVTGVTGALSPSCSPPHQLHPPRRPMRRRRLDAETKAYLSSREARQMRESDLEREQPAWSGVDAQAPARAPRPTQPGGGGGSGRGGRRRRAFGAAAARPAVGDDLRDGGGRAPGLRAARSRQSASARCVAEPAG